MTINFVLTDFLYNACRKLHSQTSDYELFSRSDIPKKVDMSDDYLQLGGYAHMLCALAQPSS